MSDTHIADRIEQKIDREITGGLAIIGTGGATNIAPRNMGELMEFAKLMALSGPCVRPAFRHNPGACLAISLQAFRWGMDPIAVSNKAYITKNKAGDEQIAFEAQLVHAVVNERAPLTQRLRPIYTGDGQQRRCEIIGWLKGEDESLDYKSPEIRNIPVQNSPLWKSDPDQQLFYYSVRAWARRHVPEVLLGVYTPDEIDAQETHYGPDNAVDVTPARPRRQDFKETKQESPVEIVDANGEVSTFTDPREAGETLSMTMHAAAKQRGPDGAHGIWESNGLAITMLRERGFNELADSLMKEFEALTAEPRTQPEPEQKAAETRKDDPAPERQATDQRPQGDAPAAKATAKKAEPAKKQPDMLGNQQPLEQRDLGHFGAGATSAPYTQGGDLSVGNPNSPIAKEGPKGNWLVWGPWFFGQLKSLSMDKVSDFIAAHSREYDYMSEHRPEMIAEADQILEARKKGPS